MRVGRASVDKFGDVVMAAALAGDGWRRRHDEVKMKLLGLLRWAGVQVDCEVFNIFAGLIPQQGLSRMEQGRKRQGLPSACSCCRWRKASSGGFGASRIEGYIMLPNPIQEESPRNRESSGQKGSHPSQ